ncbi:Microtubule-actin cross-linking factor 1, isoforms 1/2/3/5 [Geodia barretti]|uniref:Microtubule-actin cross-linking factor 1, isoforms 1/2/3/5 n=1 Tax=Geodia barretti TaxID=519541 RepID=A0AA35TWG2_GEOBA|nr:Microtubule-actin cross-linking factor 1, isoforms 1/2/3/5 [Geodia barretti]
MMEDVASRADEKAKLHSLVQELTSELSADNEERAALLQQLSDVNREWEELQQQLSECQEKLDSAHSHAAPYEDALERLFPWIPDTLARLEGLGACPTEPEAVEQRKNKIEAMKGEYNTLAPVCAGCLDNARSLSSLTDPGDPKTALDDHTSRLHDDWERLGALFGDVLAKLTEALVQTQEFKSIADGLEQWMTGMGGTLNQQDLIAARVNLVEGQIEGFKPILTDVAAYGETVEKTRALGSSLKEESEEEEREKIDRRLEALSCQFAELQNAADERMRVDKVANPHPIAINCSFGCAIILSIVRTVLQVWRRLWRELGSTRGGVTVVDQWLGQAESRLRSRDPLSIASQPLTRQELEISEFQQEVESYGPAVEGMTQSEETLFSAALASILSCEPGVLRQAAVTRRSSTPRSSLSPLPYLLLHCYIHWCYDKCNGFAMHVSPVKPEHLSLESLGVTKGERGTGYTRDEVVESSSDLPQWLERPGATEAVVVGADIRARYAALKTEAGNKADEAAQLLQTVLGYEADCCHMKEWLGGQSSTIAGFAPPGITVETIRAQLTEVEDLERGFTNTRERLESVNARGTTLVDGCRDELSRESGRSSLAELNESWGECLAALSEREEMLKRALELAEKYQEGYGEFDTWLSGCVEKAAEALKVDGDPSEINRQLNEQQALLEEVKGRKPALTALVSGGRALEDYVMENRAEGVADIGYTKMEQRYNTLQYNSE